MRRGMATTALGFAALLLASSQIGARPEIPGRFDLEPQNTAPAIPTIAEAGVPGYDADLWLGLWGPAKLEPAIATRLHAEVAKVLRQPDVRERLAGQGMEPVARTPAEYRAFVVRENEKWSKVVKAAGVKAE